MKYLVRVFLFHVFALWLTSELVGTLLIDGGWQTTLMAGLVLSLLMLVVQPLLKILFIPINMITFGLFSWAINVIVLYILTIFVSEVEIVAWTFPGANWAGFIIPQIHLTYGWALVVTSIILTILTNILHWSTNE